MLLNKGEYNNKMILSKQTFNAMIIPPKGFEKFGRSLGWDNYSTYSSDHGSLFHKTATFGHTGNTVPSILVDPTNNIAVIFLCHRVHPFNTGSLVDFRAKLANIIGGGL